METTPADVLEFWFGADLDSPEAVGARSALWFASDPDFDRSIRDEFGALPDSALRGDLVEWTQTPQSTLALIIALDQFPRNLFRGTARAFAYDAAALTAAQQALDRGVDGELHPVEAVFLFLPFEHAEDREIQSQSVSHYVELAARAPQPLQGACAGFLDYARQHQAVIEKFGRFPHRNAALGRKSSEDERTYIESGGGFF